MRFVYSEVFARCPKTIEQRIVANTRRAVEAMHIPGTRVRWFRNRGRAAVEIRGTVPLRDAADLVVSEFIPFSGVGELPFARMWKHVIRRAVVEAVLSRESK